MPGYELVEHEFYDADKPQHPMALPTGAPFVLVRTEVVDQGYGHIPSVINGKLHVPTKEVRAATFRHYVRRKQ